MHTRSKHTLSALLAVVIPGAAVFLTVKNRNYWRRLPDTRQGRDGGRCIDPLLYESGEHRKHTLAVHAGGGGRHGGRLRPLPGDARVFPLADRGVFAIDLGPEPDPSTLRFYICGWDLQRRSVLVQIGAAAFQ
ncbi:MAG: hypothetical protein HFF17_03000 [Oscillospiraceae bacterium]|nr:hypothetical protein [Oscillospiraceae bacterium]